MSVVLATDGGPSTQVPCSGCLAPPGWHRTPRAWATIHILSRLCGAPTSLAPSTPHLASYPIEAKSPRTTSSPRTVSIGEFSTNANLGRTSQMMRANSFQSPDLSPVIPAPAPADDMSWQGNPPETTSTIPRQGLPSKVQTSSQIGKGGRSPSFCRATSTLAGYGSISTAQTVSQPSIWLIIFPS